MQLFVRGVSGRTSVLEMAPGASVWEVKQSMETLCGMPAGEQVLSSGCGRLSNESAVAAGTTLFLSGRLAGGKPTKVKIITPHLPCGSEVTIDIEASASKDEIKTKLAAATGVPPEHQRVMLSGINQICMGDRRTNISFAACGSASGVQMAVPSK